MQRRFWKGGTKFNNNNVKFKLKTQFFDVSIDKIHDFKKKIAEKGNEHEWVLKGQIEKGVKIQLETLEHV